MSLYTIPPPLKMELSCVLESKSSDNCSLINVLVTIVGWGTAFALQLVASIGLLRSRSNYTFNWLLKYSQQEEIDYESVDIDDDNGDFNENNGDLSPSSDWGDNVKVVEGDNDELKMPYNRHDRNLVI